MDVRAVTSTTLAPGTVFAGRYRVGRGIGAGGMGAVYEAAHLGTGQRRALKVMLPHISMSAACRDRFRLEARVAALVRSEHIAEVFDAGVDDASGMPYLAMELLEGEDLARRLDHDGRLSPAEVVAHLHEAGLALDSTHRCSVVHRDLKPENLFLAERAGAPATIKLLDFGIAKILEEGALDIPTQCVGTPLYMAPEQLDPRARLTGATDVHALGLIAYTLLVGEPYWLEESLRPNLLALAAAIVRGPKDLASERAAAAGVTLPAAFDAWFARVTAPHPDDRFPTARAAVAALAATFAVPPPWRGVAGITGHAASPLPGRAPPRRRGATRAHSEIGGATTEVIGVAFGQAETRTA